MELQVRTRCPSCQVRSPGAGPAARAGSARDMPPPGVAAATAGIKRDADDDVLMCALAPRVALERRRRRPSPRGRSVRLPRQRQRSPAGVNVNVRRSICPRSRPHLSPPRPPFLLVLVLVLLPQGRARAVRRARAELRRGRRREQARSSRGPVPAQDERSDARAGHQQRRGRGRRRTRRRRRRRRTSRVARVVVVVVVAAAVRGGARRVQRAREARPRRGGVSGGVVGGRSRRPTPRDRRRVADGKRPAARGDVRRRPRRYIRRVVARAATRDARLRARVRARARAARPCRWPRLRTPQKHAATPRSRRSATMTPSPPTRTRSGSTAATMSSVRRPAVTQPPAVCV